MVLLRSQRKCPPRFLVASLTVWVLKYQEPTVQHSVSCLFHPGVNPEVSLSGPVLYVEVVLALWLLMSQCLVKEGEG